MDTRLDYCVWPREDGWFIIFRIFKSIFFSQLSFIVLFPFLIKYDHILFIIIVFWLECDRPSGLPLFVPALLLSILTPLFLPSSSVSLSYFVLAVPMRECLGKHWCMSSPKPYFFPKLSCYLGRSFIYQNQITLN